MTDLDLSYSLYDANGILLGELDEAIERKFKKRRNLTATVEITTRMEDELASYLVPSQRPRVKVYRAATTAELASNPAAIRVLLFYGLLPSTDIKDDTETGLTTCTFRDPRVRLTQAYTLAPVQFVSTAQGSILWSLIATYQARMTTFNTYLAQGATAATPLRDRNYDAGKKLSGLIDDMTKVDLGCDVDCQAIDSLGNGVMGLFHSYTTQGIDRPDANFVFGRPNLGSNCEIERGFGPTVTFASAQGTAADGTATVQSYPPVINSGYGLLEEYETISDASVAATLLAKATGVVVANQDPQWVIKIKKIMRDAPVPFVDYDLADYVRLSGRKGTIVMDRVPIRIEGFDLSTNTDGVTQVDNLYTSGDL